MFFSVCLCIVDFCFVFKLLLQTRSIELPTYSAPISFPLYYARSLWSAIYLGWCKSGGGPGVQPWLRGPHTQRYTGVFFYFYHTSRWESSLVGNPTWSGIQPVQQQPLPLVLKLMQEICYLCLHRCFKRTELRFCP